MKTSETNRVDEVSKYYESAKKAGSILHWLFVIVTLISVTLLFSSLINDKTYHHLQSLFIVGVIALFSLSQTSRFYLIPKAEKMRRRQMLSNAFDTPLIQETTQHYYNNDYAPSLLRLGANTMENAYFSKEVSSRMLSRNRFFAIGYLLLWLIFFSIRDTDLNTLIWITQFVLSGEIIAKWINLEILRARFEHVYEQLHSHFLHSIEPDTTTSTATILDAVISYEATKSASGTLLSSKIFKKINPQLTTSWQEIRNKLNMNAA